MSLGMPVIRIELRGMKQTILHAFTRELAALDVNVQEAVESAIEHYDVKREVETVVEQVLRERIKDAITGAMYQIRWDTDLQALLVERIRAALAKSVEEA